MADGQVSKMHKNLQRYRCIDALIGMIALTLATSLRAEDTDQSNVLTNALTPPPLYISEQVSYDSNLFRLNRTIDVKQSPLGSTASRDDEVLRSSAGANTDWHAGLQELKLELNLDDNRFRYNRILNNTSGNGTLLWNWRTADDWYGKLGGTYVHALSSFVNDRPLTKDLVDSYQYFGELNHDFGSYVEATIGGKHVQAVHGDDSRKVDNYTSNSGNVGLTLNSLAGNYIGVAWERTRAIYPFDVFINDAPFNRDYEENTSFLRFRYASSIKTIVYGSVGHVSREYLHGDGRQYSAATWQGTWHWQPTTKTIVEVSGWQKLNSYFDLAADHFIGRGFSVAPTWLPRDRLAFSATFGWERQQYILRDVLAGEGDIQREDKVTSAYGEMLYSPVDWLDFTLSYRYEHHDSTLFLYGFDDRIASIRLRGKF